MIRFLSQHPGAESREKLISRASSAPNSYYVISGWLVVLGIYSPMSFVISMMYLLNVFIVCAMKVLSASNSIYQQVCNRTTQIASFQIRTIEILSLAAKPTRSIPETIKEKSWQLLVQP